MNLLKKDQYQQDRFVVQEFKPGEQTVVVRNENYWNGKAKLAKVTFKDINDQNTRALSLKSGEIDVAYNLKVTNKANFEGDKKYCNK